MYVNAVSHLSNMSTVMNKLTLTRVTWLGVDEPSLLYTLFE